MILYLLDKYALLSEEGYVFTEELFEKACKEYQSLHNPIKAMSSMDYDVEFHETFKKNRITNKKI